MSLRRIELLDFRIFAAAAFTPETEGTTVISGPNGTGKTSVLEAMGYLGTQRSFRGAPREAMVRTGGDRAIIRAELRNDASPTLVEAEIVPAGRSRTQVNRKTATGRKDLAVAAKRMIERDGAAIVVVLAMPGSAPIDKQCAHEASLGIMQAQLMTSTPILEVFVHEDESDDPKVLADVFEHRSRSHARNAYWMLFEPDQLARRAGTGVRQGFADAGPLETA